MQPVPKVQKAILGLLAHRDQLARKVRKGIPARKDPKATLAQLVRTVPRVIQGLQEQADQPENQLIRFG